MNFIYEQCVREQKWNIFQMVKESGGQDQQRKRCFTIDMVLDTDQFSNRISIKHFLNFTRQEKMRCQSSNFEFEIYG